MAIIKCPDCGKDISELAVSCIGCGRPMGAGTPKAASPIATDLSVYSVLALIGSVLWGLLVVGLITSAEARNPLVFLIGFPFLGVPLLLTIKLSKKAYAKGLSCNASTAMATLVRVLGWIAFGIAGLFCLLGLIVKLVLG